LLEEESQLVLRSKNGDQIAYEKLYIANIGKVFALCLRLCGQRELAEDLAQEAFIRAWQKIGSFRGDSKFSSWLFRLTSNVVIGHLRKHNKWQTDSLDEEGSYETADWQQTQSIDRPFGLHQEIDKALRCLSDNARVVLIMHEYLGYQHNEISAITGMAIGTSKTHLHRARTTLKAQAERTV
jgi:RNA polymerase sigma-70 factor (ECF subfamily)